MTFDRSAAKFVLEALGYVVKGENEIYKLRGIGEKEFAECGVCGRRITVGNFAGAIKGIGLMCDRLPCLFDAAVSKEWKKACGGRRHKQIKLTGRKAGLCPECGTKCVNAPGIGLYCPNPKCDEK